MTDDFDYDDDDTTAEDEPTGLAALEELYGEEFSAPMREELAKVKAEARREILAELDPKFAKREAHRENEAKQLAALNAILDGKGEAGARQAASTAKPKPAPKPMDAEDHARQILAAIQDGDQDRYSKLSGGKRFSG